MKTDDLITAIAADAGAPRAPIGRTVWLAAGIAAIICGALFLTLLPIRPDMPAALGDPRFLFKWAFTLSLLLSALVLIVQLARPQTLPAPLLILLLAGPLVLGIGIASEMIALPAIDWVPTMIGTNALSCVIYIPILSAPPLIVMLLALRQGAPAHPALAGAVAGLVGAGIGATFYAMHCQNDSPLFLAAWYLLATAFVTATGAVLGDRLLRW